MKSTRQVPCDPFQVLTSSGGQVWEGYAHGEHDIGLSFPAVADGKVFIRVGTYLAAFDESSGGLTWSFDTGNEVAPGEGSSPAVVAGRALVGGHSSGGGWEYLITVFKDP